MLHAPTKPKGGARLPVWKANPFEALRRDMGELWRSFGDGEEWAAFEGLEPTVDMCEKADAVEVKMDLPGMKLPDIDVRLDHNLLTVQGERREEREEGDKRYHRIERRNGFFSRTMTLPCEVRDDQVDARYQDGVLFVTLPKCEPAKTKKIAVKGAK
jgi:HSP20 family protein